MNNSYMAVSFIACALWEGNIYKPNFVKCQRCTMYARFAFGCREYMRYAVRFLRFLFWFLIANNSFFIY